MDPKGSNGGTAELSPGKHEWLMQDLQPGEHFAFNNVPGPNYNVPVFVTVSAAPTTAPATGGSRAGGEPLLLALLLGLALLGTGGLLWQAGVRAN